jgi:hypothetical protein
MPELFPKTKQYPKRRVRSVMVQQPMITIVGIQQRLAHDGWPLDRRYFASLVRAIQTERIRAETWRLDVALSSFQDSMAEIARVGWEIVNDQMASRICLTSWIGSSTEEMRFYSEPSRRELSSNIWFLTLWNLIQDRGNGEHASATDRTCRSSLLACCGRQPVLNSAVARSNAY